MRRRDRTGIWIRQGPRVDFAGNSKLSQSRSKVGFQPFAPGDHRRRLPGTEKARKMIRWGPKASLEEGLERTLRWVTHRIPAEKYSR